jgi:hypothetical protein
LKFSTYFRGEKRIKILTKSGSNQRKKGTDPVWKLKPVILATWEAEIRKIVVQGLPGQKVWETPISVIGWVL